MVHRNHKMFFGEMYVCRQEQSRVSRVAYRFVPAFKPYRYVMTQDRVLIVDPSDHKIADVVAPSK